MPCCVDPRAVHATWKSKKLTCNRSNTSPSLSASVQVKLGAGGDTQGPLFTEEFREFYKDIQKNVARVKTKNSCKEGHKSHTSWRNNSWGVFKSKSSTLELG